MLLALCSVLAASAAARQAPAHELMMQSQARRSLVTFPANSTAIGGTANLTWPSAAFQSWCLGNSQCSVLPNATTVQFLLSVLPFGSDAWSATTLATTLAASLKISQDQSVTNVRAVSDAADVGLSPSTIKTDTYICSSTEPCEAQLAFRLTGASLTDPVVCIRLVRQDSGTYKMEGFPSGDGVYASSAMFNNNITCSTNQLGLHAVVQFTRVSVPPPPMPPRPPPPPPMATATGKPEVPEGPVSILFGITFRLDFPSLASNNSLIANFTKDTTWYLAQNLAAAYPGLFQNASNTLPYYSRLTLASISPGSVVAAYRVKFPQGVGEDEVNAVSATLQAEAAGLLLGSVYRSLLVASQVLSVDGMKNQKLQLWQLILIICGSVVGAGLLVVAIAWYVRLKRRSSILPDDEDTQATADSKKKKKKKKKGTDEDKNRQQATQDGGRSWTINAPPTTPADALVPASQPPASVPTPPPQPAQQNWQQQQQQTPMAFVMLPVPAASLESLQQMTMAQAGTSYTPVQMMMQQTMYQPAGMQQTLLPPQPGGGPTVRRG